MIVLPESLLAPLPDATPLPGSLTGTGATPARFGGPLPAVPLLAAPFAQEMSAVPSQTWPAGMAEPSVWNPPAERLTWAEREDSRFPQPPPGPLDRRPGEANGIGSMPKGGASPPDSEDEFLPIFAAVESAWFCIAATLAESPTEEPSTAEFPAVDSGRAVPSEPRTEPDFGRPPVTAAGGPPRRRASPPPVGRPRRACPNGLPGTI